MPRHGTPCLGEILLLKLHATAAMDAGGMLCLQHCICISGHGNSYLRKNAQCVCNCLQGPAKTWSALFSIICILAFSYLVNGAFVFGQLCVCLLLVSVATLPFSRFTYRTQEFLLLLRPWSMVLTCSRTSSSYPASVRPPPPGLKFFLFL